MHKQAVGEWEAKHPRPLLMRSDKSSKAVSAWHAYVAQHRKNHSMAEVGAMWQLLGEEGKAQYAEMAAAAQQEVKEDKNIDLSDFAVPNSATPFGLGSESQPLRTDVVEPLCQGDAIQRGVRAWRSMTGVAIPEPPEPYDAPPVPSLLCGEVYGPGQCVQRLPAAVKERCDALRHVLRNAAIALGREDSLKLLYLRPAEDAPGDLGPEVPRHLFFMICFSLFRDPEVLRYHSITE